MERQYHEFFLPLDGVDFCSFKRLTIFPAGAMGPQFGTKILDFLRAQGHGHRHCLGVFGNSTWP